MTINRQHTIELWYHPSQGHLCAVFTQKDWYWADYADSAPLEHFRWPTQWGLVHILVFGWPVGKEIALNVTQAVLDGKVKVTKFDDLCGTNLTGKK